MSKLPAAYEWLYRETAPRMLLEAIELHGVTEVAGKADSPIILGWARELGIAGAYSDDEIPWCGLFMGVCAKRAGWDYAPLGNPLWARNWMRWGNPADRPMLGDVGVKKRGTGGHVFMYVGEDDRAYHALGGNQRDQVCIVRILKDDDILGFRRAPWRIAQPSNVRPVFLDPAGAALSTKED